MRGLVVNGAAALGGVELLRAARTVEKIGEHHRADHAQAAVLAARDELSGERNGRIEAMAVADDQMHAVFARRSSHGAAFLERERHWLFDENVLAGLGGE